MKKIFILFLIFYSIISSISAQKKSGMDGIYGVCEHTTHSNYQFYLDKKVYPIMQNAGIGMVRSDIVWPWNRDEQNGIWVYSNLDKVINQMGDVGMGFLPILTGAPQNAWPVYNNLGRWEDFVSSFVNRYKKQCRYWEIWNEHNFPNDCWWVGDNWPVANPNHIKSYVTVLKSAHQTIKRIDPSLQVVYGGTAGVPIDYIEATLKEGAGNYFDVMNVHPYSWSSNPENYLRDNIRNLKQVMAKYNVNKPIWVTEIGWPTATQPENLYYKQVLSIAFNKLNMNTLSIPIVFIDEVMGYKHDFVKEFPKFKEVVTIPIEKLKDLDPEKYPVLVPTQGEYFKYYYTQDLINYVKKGGTIILPESLPFYYNVPVYDEKGNARKCVYNDGYNIREALHFQTDGWFMTGDRIEIPGVDANKIRHFENQRFVLNRCSKPGDTYTPLAYAVNGNSRAEIAALINLNSDLKGNIIVCTQLDTNKNDDVTVSEEAQAQVVQRAHLLMFAEGVEKVFWYKFSSLANGAQDIPKVEENFGIVHRNMDTKPAYHSYKVLTEMYPDGSTTPTIVKKDSGLYIAEWKRPDNKKVYGVWTSYGKMEFNSSFITGNVQQVKDYMGKSMGNFAPRYTASPGITFFVCDDDYKANNIAVESDNDAFVAKIYPIPTSGVFTLELPELKDGEVGSILVYSTMGVVVNQKTVSGKQEFDLSTFAKGYYIVRITVGDNTVIKKIITN